MLKIALIGHDTRNANLGVGALTISSVEIIRSIARRRGIAIEVIVLAGRGTQHSRIDGIDITERFIRPLRKPWDFFWTIRSSDLVIDISGGDSFSDIYGARRVFQILLQKYLVHLAGRSLVMAPQTIGPFRNHVWRALAAQTIRWSAIVGTRDDKSTDYLYEMGVKRDVVEASDVALRLPYEGPVASHDGAPRVGLNVSGLLMNGGYTHNNMFGLTVDYPALIRKIIQGFLSYGDGCEVHLVGHVIPQTRGGVEDDYQACLDLAAEFPRVIVAPAFETPVDAKSYIATLDFFMGARMHACIAAFSSGVPVIPMAYSRKFAGFFGSLGYNYTVDCTIDAADDIQHRIFQAYEARATLAHEVNAALLLGRQRLGVYEEALEALLVRFTSS